MKTEPELTQIVRSWLDDGVDRAPDWVLDGALDELAATPQRRPRWSARRYRMPTIARVAVAAAALVAVTVGLVTFLPAGNPIAGPGASIGASLAPSLAPSPSVAPSPSDDGIVGPEDVGARLPEGVSHLGAPFAVPFTVTLPQGWRANALAEGAAVIGRPVREDPYVYPIDVGAYVVTDVFGDLCGDAEPLSPPPSLTTAGIQEALASIDGLTATPVEDPGVGGHAAMSLTLANNLDPIVDACVDRTLRLLTYRGDAGEPDGVLTTAAAQHLVRIVDIDGTIVVFVAEWTPQQDAATSYTSAQEARESAQAILDSITFD